MKTLIDTAAGREKAGLVLKNANIVDVFGSRILQGDVALCGEYIAGVGHYEGKEEIDLKGRFILPGLIDTHVHIESSMVTPAQYAKEVLLHGVTTVIADPHEIANVCGEAGLNFMKKDADGLPLDIEYMLPSCVPATPFEHSGAQLDSRDIQRLAPNYFGLGEMMNYPGIVQGDPETLSRLVFERVDGHAPFLSGKELNAYAAAGIQTDHECTTLDEMYEKIACGMYILIREGTLSKDLSKLLPGIQAGTLRRCCFCTDDRFIGSISKHGSIDHCIRKSIQLGLSPIDAAVIATRNAAECYGLKKKGAIAPGYYADLLISEDLELSAIHSVYKNGKAVAEHGVLLFEPEIKPLPAKITGTVHLPPVGAGFFDCPLPQVPFAAIELIPHSITTKKVTVSYHHDLTKVCVLERHHNTGCKSFGWVTNYHITGGAIASSVGHDSHNVIVAGDNDDAMALAVNTLGNSGGIAVCSPTAVLAFFPLPVAGLMSDLDAKAAAKMHSALYEAASTLQIPPEIDPFLSLSFLALPVIPELRLTDQGLFDVAAFEFLENEE